MNRCLIAALLLLGCQAEHSERDANVTDHANVPVVIVTTYPLFEMVSDLARDAVTVRWLNDDAADPRLWTPAAADVRTLQSADLILLNGAGYEPWAQNLSLPQSRTIDTSRAYSERLLRATDVVTHQHGPQGAVAEGLTVPVTWLDPELAIAQLRQVERQLVQLVPQQQTQISRRASALVRNLEQTGQVLDDLAAQTVGRQVLTQSSDYCYLTTRLGWKIVVANPAFDSKQTVASDSTSVATVETSTDVLGFSNRLDPDVRPDDAGVAADQWVSIDLCETRMAQTTLWERLEGNVRRLQNTRHPPPEP